MVQLRNSITGEIYTAEEGTTLLDLSHTIQDDQKFPVAAALYNNDLVGLQNKITRDGEVEWISLASKEGNQCIQRTLTFLLVRAVADLYPDGKVQVRHSLGKALYCEIPLGRTLTAEDVEAIERRMHELADQDDPISQLTVSMETAMNMCCSRHMEREAEMLRHVQVDKIRAYQSGPVFDYYMGPLLPRMGYVKCFALRHYAPGLLLRYPDQQNPDVLAPYVEIPKLARVFLEAEDWGRIVRLSLIHI